MLLVVTGGANLQKAGFFPSTDFELCSWLSVAEAIKVGWLLINVFFHKAQQAEKNDYWSNSLLSDFSTK